MADLVAEASGVSLYHCDWRDLLAVVPRCDAVIVDAPYSEKTHKGHDTGTALTSKVWERSNGKFDVPAARRSISYDAWTEADVGAFVAAWHPLCEGWIVSITDDILAPVWKAALEAAGRYAFAPIPYIAPGSRVRLSGDGPSAWTCWIVAGGTPGVAAEVMGPCEASAQIIVARPRTREYASWGTLPGAYVLPPGMAERMPVVGGKPPWLLCRLCEDYSRPGGLVVDPTCGAGTAGIGAIRTGRRAVLGDLCREHVDLAAAWIKNPHAAPPGSKSRPLEGQAELFR